MGRAGPNLGRRCAAGARGLIFVQEAHGADETFTYGGGGFLRCVPLGLCCLGMPGQRRPQRRRSGMPHYESPLSLRDYSVGLGHQLLQFDDSLLHRALVSTNSARA